MSSTAQAISNTRNTLSTPFERVCFAIVLTATLLATGCSSSPSTKTSEVNISEYSFWPQFPAEPRVQFLVAYRYSSDIDVKKSQLEELVYGKESSVLPISKPYGVQMWDGKIYVCDIRNPGVVVLDLVKRQTRIMTTRGLGGMVQPTDITVSSDGMKYVADSVRGVIFVFDAKETHVNSFGHEGFKPVGIAVHGDRLYISDFATQSVIVMDRKDGSILQHIGGPGGDDGKFIRPLGIGTDAEGNIYVSDVIKCRLQKFNPRGELVNAVGQISDTAGSFVRPKHVAVDKSGIVYVADAAFDNVQMFNKEGQVLMFFGSGGGHPGAMNLPAGVSINENDIQLFKQYIHPAFKADRLILVTNQFGPNKVAVYALGSLRKGKTIDDIASSVSDMSSGIQTEEELENFNNEDLPGAIETPKGDANPSEEPGTP